MRNVIRGEPSKVPYGNAPFGVKWMRTNVWPPRAPRPLMAMAFVRAETTVLCTLRTFFERAANAS